MMKMKKDLNRFLATLLIFAMVLTSNGMITFASSEVVSDIIEEQINMHEQYENDKG